MTTPPTSELTQLLVDWRRGDKAALDKLMPIVYQELRRILLIEADIPNCG